MNPLRSSFLILIILLTGISWLLAQTPDAGKADDPMVDALQFPNSSINEILATYEKLTGKRIVRDALLASAGTPLTIVTSKPLHKSEAIRFIEAALLLNGYTISPGPDGSLKIINSATGKTPRSEGIPMYANADDLPTGDKIVSFYLPLKFIPTAQAAGIFREQAPPHAAYGFYSEVPHTQAIVLTESTSVIRQILALKELIDVPPAEVVSKVIRLQKADAEKVAEMINKLVDNAKKGTPNPQPGALQPPGATAGLEYQLVAGDAQIVPDPHTNSIMIVTRPINLPFLEGLIAQFDQSSSVIEPYVRTLKYITPVELKPVIQNLLTDTKDDTTQSAATPPANNQQNQSQNRANSPGGSAGSGGPALPTTLLPTEPVTTPDSLVVGKTKVIFDVRNNSILVVGPPESVDKVRALLDQMDIKPRQVYLATVVGKLTLNSTQQMSIDLLQNFSHYTGNIGIASALSNGASSAHPDPTTLTNASVFPNPLQNGGTFYGAAGSALNYYVQALESTGRFTVLARPSVFTANNKKASIASGVTVPYAGSTVTTASSTAIPGSTSATASFVNVTLSLEIIPLINENKEVNLQIAQQNNTLASNITISGNPTPVVATDALVTTVTVPNNSTLVLGGLVRDSDTSTRTGLPWISNIPILGALFRGDSKTRERDELVILMQPQVIESDEELAAIQKTERARENIGKQSLEYSEKTPPPTISTKGKVP